MTTPSLTIVCTGDSITDCGRRDPALAPLGVGYAKLVADLLIVRQPARPSTIVNTGIGGQTIAEVAARWDADVLAHQPAVLVMLIGINDLWLHKIKDARAVSPTRYAEVYADVMARTRRALPACRYILLEPFFIVPEATAVGEQRQVLDLLREYRAVAARMAAAPDAAFLPTHELFQGLLKYRPATTFCAEPVHPNATGHLVIAEAVYERLARVLAEGQR